MLADPTARVLQQLARRPATVNEVAESVSLASAKVCNDRLLEQVAGILLQLQKVGLIEKADT